MKRIILAVLEFFVGLPMVLLGVCAGFLFEAFRCGWERGREIVAESIEGEPL
jgi:hypothetical protein